MKRSQVKLGREEGFRYRLPLDDPKIPAKKPNVVVQNPAAYEASNDQCQVYRCL